MFVEAIEEISQFTRPIHIISRQYGHKEISSGSGTMFFVNEFGDAITCKHVTDVIIQSETINHNFRQFRNERIMLRNDPQEQLLTTRLEQKYGYSVGTTITQKLHYPNTVAGFSEIQITPHPLYDLALVQFPNFSQKLYQNHARFIKYSSTIKQGRSLCRYGFPFTEFTNFGYNSQADDIEWTNQGRAETPAFPIEGMLTRFIGNEKGEKIGIEVSTPGLRGQSGGPLFDTQGLVYGMQSMTRHLHLGFDMVNFEVMLESQRAKVSNHPFLHVGQCVHVDIIKQFLSDNKIVFYEE